MGLSSYPKLCMIPLLRVIALSPLALLLPASVFLQHQFADFRSKPDESKMLDILRKSWAKMGDKGRQAALGLALGPEEAALVGKALAG